MINIEDLQQDGIDFLCQVEGFKSKPYLDTKRIWTIGIGTTILPCGEKVTADTTAIDKNTAIQYMSAYINIIQEWMQKNLRWQPNHYQTIVLYSFLYNIGLGSVFNKCVHTKQAIIDGDIKNIIAGLRTITNGGRLTKRRETEITLFIKKVEY